MKTLQPLQGNEIRLQGVAEGLSLGGDVTYGENQIHYNDEDINYNEHHLFYNNVEVLPSPQEEPAGGGENEVPQGNDPVDEPAEEAPVEEEQPMEEEAEPEEEAEEAPVEEDDEEEEEEEEAEVEEVDPEAATTTPQQRTQLQTQATIAPLIERGVAPSAEVLDSSEESGVLPPDSAPFSESAERSFLKQAFEALEGLDDDIGVAG